MRRRIQTTITSRGRTALAIPLLLVALLGAVGWGLVALFGFDALESLLGDEALARAAFGVVGLCGLLGLFFLPSLRVQRPGTPKREEAPPAQERGAVIGDGHGRPAHP